MVDSLFCSRNQMPSVVIFYITSRARTNRKWCISTISEPQLFDPLFSVSIVGESAFADLRAMNCVQPFNPFPIDETLLTPGQCIAVFIKDATTCTEPTHPHLPSTSLVNSTQNCCNVERIPEKDAATIPTIFTTSILRLTLSILFMLIICNRCYITIRLFSSPLS